MMKSQLFYIYSYIYGQSKTLLLVVLCLLYCSLNFMYQYCSLNLFLFYEPAMTTTKLPLVG